MVGLRLFASLSCLSMPKPMLAMYSSVPPYVSLQIHRDFHPQQLLPSVSSRSKNRTPLRITEDI